MCMRRICRLGREVRKKIIEKRLTRSEDGYRKVRSITWRWFRGPYKDKDSQP